MLLDAQRFSAAFRAIADRSAALSFAALALPPFMPPLCPRSTAAGSRWSGSGSASPMVRSSVSLARWLGSRGILVFFMDPVCAASQASSTGLASQTDALPTRPVPPLHTGPERGASGPWCDGRIQTHAGVYGRSAAALRLALPPSRLGCTSCAFPC